MTQSCPPDQSSALRWSVAAALIVAALGVAALCVRSFGVLDTVIRDDGVYLQGADAWHHLRQVQQWVLHFPQRMTFDPFALHPSGQPVTVAPLFDLVAATLALVLGAGSPSPRTVAQVTAWLPAMLGAATCIPVYAIARRASGRAAGLLATICVAVLPGQFLSRTRLGFADHHALEALLVPAAVWALSWALAAGDRRRALYRSVVAGLVLLLYLLSWTGSALIVLVLGAWAVLQIHIDHSRGTGGVRTGEVAAGFFGTALVGHSLVAWDLPYANYQRLGLVGALVASVALGALHRALSRGHRSRIHLPMATLAVTAGAAAVLARVSPDTLRGGWHALTWFAGSGLQETVGEASPLLRPQGAFSFTMAWAHYGTVLPGAIVAIAVLARRIVREGRAIDTLLAVWSLAMLVATLGQNRFGYYFATSAAVLCGVLVGPPLARLWHARDGDVPMWIRRGLWPAAAVIGLVVPVAPVALATMRSYDGPSQAWIDALRHLRNNTVEPFGDAAAYERIVAPEDAPEADWGVLAWWDGGYWITTLGRRVPAANPTQAGAGTVARLLLMTNPEAAAAACREQRLSYVLLDGDVPMLPMGPGQLGGEIGQIAHWAGVDPDELYRTYQRQDARGTWSQIVLFEPAYYETLAVRLHVFGGRAVEPKSTTQLVRWRDVPDSAGGTLRQITQLERFETFERAARRLQQAVEAGDTNVRIVSDDPLYSCVPLQSADAFRQDFASSQSVAGRPFDRIAEVQIYRVLGADADSDR